MQMTIVSMALSWPKPVVLDYEILDAARSIAAI